MPGQHLCLWTLHVHACYTGMLHDLEHLCFPPMYLNCGAANTVVCQGRISNARTLRHALYPIAGSKSLWFALRKRLHQTVQLRDRKDVTCIPSNDFPIESHRHRNAGSLDRDQDERDSLGSVVQ